MFNQCVWLNIIYWEMGLSRVRGKYNVKWCIGAAFDEIYYIMGVAKIIWLFCQKKCLGNAEKFLFPEC